MNNPVRILGIAGSLRQKSHNRGALRAGAELAPDEKTKEYIGQLLQNLVEWTRRVGHS